MKLRWHRPLRGIPKTCTVRREGRRWRVTVFCADVPAQPLPATGKVVGLDLGVTHLVTTSDGQHLANHRPGKRAQDRLATLSRAFARTKRGSGRRRRAAQAIGAVHRTVARHRRDRAHQLSRRLVNEHDLIAVEDLHIPNMTRRPRPRPGDDGIFLPNGATAKAGLNRCIHDAGWGQLLRFIAYKAEDAGRHLIAVDARHTSQRCGHCGHTAAGNRHGAVFRCLGCGHQADADVNAAGNILRAGLAQREAQAEREVA